MVGALGLNMIQPNLLAWLALGDPPATTYQRVPPPLHGGLTTHPHRRMYRSPPTQTRRWE